MANIKIVLINKSSVVSDEEIEKCVCAFQKQISRDFAPIWGIDADIFFSKNRVIPPGHWWCVISDTSDVDGALGYHELTAEGNPICYVFAKSDIDNNLNWTVTASHELLEMLLDPNVNLTILSENPKGGLGKLYSYEVCDACEDDKFAYSIDGVMVSDFVYPAWFEDFRSDKSTQFDYKNLIRSPFQLLPGGYINVLDMNQPQNGWHQLNAKSEKRKGNARCFHFYKRKNKFKHVNWIQKILRFSKQIFKNFIF